MNQYKTNHEFYQSAFDEICASDELVMKVKNMTKDNTKKKKFVIRKAVYIAAAIITMLIASNAVVYAATGATWIEHIITATVDGSDYNASLIDKYDENGVLDSQEIIVDYGNGIKEGIEYDGQYAIDDSSKPEMQFEGNKPTIVQESNKVFFRWQSANVNEDITDDFADGQAKVTVERDDNAEMTFTITGTVDEYKIVASSGGDSFEISD